MEITQETRSYDPKRMGRPWIATIEFPKGVSGCFRWGVWKGDRIKGGAGILTINAKPGDIIATGQKAYQQQHSGTVVNYFVVTNEGELVKFVDKDAACNYYLKSKEVALWNL